MKKLKYQFEDKNQFVEFDGESLITIYFAEALNDNDDSLRLAEWLDESIKKIIESTDQQLFVIGDMRDTDNSLVLSKKEKNIFANIIKNYYQIDHYYAVSKSEGLNMIIRLIIAMSGLKRKVTITSSMEEAKKAYTIWKCEI